MMKRIILLGWVAMLSMSAVAQEPIVVTVVTKGAFTEAGKNIVGEAYKRIGVPVVFRDQPGERALVNTNDGKTDGELFRIDKINTRYPNLIQIPVSYIPDEVAVFSKLDIEVSDWASIKNYSTAVRRGDKFIEDSTEGMERHFVTDDINSFKMLELDRVQVVVASRWDGLEYINAIGSKSIKALSPSIVTNPLFHYLHYKHAELVPRLTVAIKEMHDDGTIKRLLAEAEASIFE